VTVVPEVDASVLQPPWTLFQTAPIFSSTAALAHRAYEALQVIFVLDVTKTPSVEGTVTAIEQPEGSAALAAGALTVITVRISITVVTNAAVELLVRLMARLLVVGCQSALDRCNRRWQTAD